MPYSNDNARRKRGQGIHWAHSAVQFAIDLSFVHDVQTGNIEYGLLPVGAADWEDGQKKHQKLE